MIRIVDIAPPVEERIAFDPHVPITIEWHHESVGDVLYWRGGDFSTSLAEVGFDSLSGVLRSFTLTAVVKRAERASIISVREGSQRIGLPQCDPGLWSDRTFADRFRDEQTPLSVSVAADAVAVRFGASSSREEVLRAGRVSFLLTADRELCGIEVHDLTSEESLVVRTLVEG